MVKLSGPRVFNCIVLRVNFGLTSYEELPPALRCLSMPLRMCTALHSVTHMHVPARTRTLYICVFVYIYIYTLASVPALSCRCMTYAHFNCDVSYRYSYVHAYL